MPDAPNHGETDAASPSTAPTTGAGDGAIGPPSALGLALRFMLPIGQPPEASSTAWRRASYWFVPIGLAIGLLWVGVFRAVWRLYGEEVTSLRLVPAAAVLLVDVLFTGYCLFGGLATTVNALSINTMLPARNMS